MSLMTELFAQGPHSARVASWPTQGAQSAGKCVTGVDGMSKISLVQCWAELDLSQAYFPNALEMCFILPIRSDSHGCFLGVFTLTPSLL